MAQHLQDVVTVSDLDRLADLVDFEREGLLVEFRLHLAVHHAVGLATLRGRAGILGIFLGHVGKVRAFGGAELLHQVVGLSLHRGIRFGVSAGLQHDVPDVDALGRAVGFLVVVVDAQQVGVGGLQVLLQLGLIDNHNAETALLGSLIGGFVGVVILVQLIGSDLNFRAQLIAGNLHVLDLDLVGAAPVFALDLLGSDNGALQGDIAQFSDE